MIKVLMSDFSQVILFPKDTGYQGSLNELFKSAYGKETSNFFDLYTINQELLDLYLELKNTYHLKVCIFTTGTVQKHVDLRPYLQPVFDQIYSVTDIRIDKTDKNAYTVLARELGVEPTEIIFIDDQIRNVEAAREAGIQAIQYTSNEQVKVEVNELF